MRNQNTGRSSLVGFCAKPGETVAMADDDSWVFDSLVCFLNGPVWNAPLQSFIEERSLIFEPNETDDPEYRKVFHDFKNMVDFMLGSFMEDIGITPKQFETACYRGAREGVPLHFDQNTFEQIWAANDYDMFRRMMCQRNVELQLQALELIEQKYGRTPESFIPKKQQDSASEETTVEISPSPAKRSEELEREILVEVSKQFSTDEPNEVQEEDQLQYLLEEKPILEEALKKTIEEKLTSQKHILEKPVNDSDDERESLAVKPPDEPVQSPKPKLEKIMIDRPQNKEVDDLELKKRQEYLRAQRDKLVALKKEARKKQLVEETSERLPSRPRPKSAKAAEKLMNSPGGNVEPQKLKLRKALVERLKSEVIQSNEH